MNIKMNDKFVAHTTAQAESRSRQVRFTCGSLEELEMTVEKYGEKLVIATQAPNELTVTMAI